MPEGRSARFRGLFRPAPLKMDVSHSATMTGSIKNVVVVAMITVGMLVFRFATRHCRPFLVERWARDNGFRILECELRRVMKGPFTWKFSSRAQYVCHVRVRDLNNRERSAWLRCTDVGIFNDDKTEVVWETEA